MLRRLVSSLGIVGVTTSSALAGAPSPFATAEARRVEAHLLGAEALLAEGPESDLDPERADRRSWAYRTLQIYRRGGLYPLNQTDQGQTPVFVDEVGTRCALGALVAASGQVDLVERISRDHNLLRVPELVAVEPELLAWLYAHGLDLAEATRIQPSYCFGRATLVCRYGRSQEGYVEVVIVGPDQARISRVFGPVPASRVGEAVRAYCDEECPVGQRWLWYMGRGIPQGKIGVVDEHGFRLPQDPPCAASPHVPVEVLVEALGTEGCVDALERRSPGWAELVCDGWAPEVDCTMPPETYPTAPWPAPDDPTEEPPAVTELPDPDASEGCRSTAESAPSLVPFILWLAWGHASRRRRGAIPRPV